MAELVTMTTLEKAQGAIPAYPSPLGFVATDGVTPARIGSVPVWESLDTNVCTVTADADGMTNVQIVSADLPADDPPRSGQVKMSFDADRGEGVTTIEILFDVTVTSIAGPNAVQLGSAIFAVVPK